MDSFLLFQAIVFFLLSIFYAFKGFKRIMQGNVDPLMTIYLGLASFNYLAAFKYPIIESSSRYRFAFDIELTVTILVLVLGPFITFIYKRIRFKEIKNEFVWSRPLPRSLYYIVGIGALIAPFMLPLQGQGGFLSVFLGLFIGMHLGAATHSILAGRVRVFLVMFFAFIISLLFFEVSSRRFYISSFFVYLFDLIVFFRQIGASKLKCQLNELGFRFSVPSRYRVIFSAALLGIFGYLVYRRAGRDFTDDITFGLNFDTLVAAFSNIDTFWNTAFVFDGFPDRFSFFFGETYLALLVAYIPRTLWEEKPVSMSAQLGYFVRTGDPGFSLLGWHEVNQFSLSTGMIGEAFANFGWVGVFFMPLLFAIVAKWLAYKISFNQVSRYMYILPFLSSGITAFRGDAYTSLHYSIVLMFGMWIFYRLFGRKTTRTLRGGVEN